MRILMLSDGETKGGASTAATRMAQGLARLGHEVLRVVCFPDAPPRGLAHNWRTEVIVTEPQMVRDWMELPCGTAQVQVQDELAKIMDEFRPHVISVHNIHGASRQGWSVSLVRQCATVAPTVWTLHDMWSATGRCAYPGACSLYLARSCDARCPSWDEYPASHPEAVSVHMTNKISVLNSCPDLVAVSPSVWLANKVKHGLWAEHRVEVLANGLDMETFYPVDRVEARSRLGLPNQGPILLAVALHLNDPRKGLDILLNALPFLAPGTTLLLMGSGELVIPDAISKNLAGVYRLGLITDDTIKTLIYSAADVLVYPSREDNLPNTIAESLACGTPVAGFSVCGVAEMLEEGGGIGTDIISPQALVQSIKSVLDQQGDAVRDCCRKLAQQRYDMLGQASKFERLFEELTATRSGH